MRLTSKGRYAVMAMASTDASKPAHYLADPSGRTLYYFAKDAKAGDTNGQEVGDVWYIVTPGMKLGEPPHEAGAEGSATPDSGY